MLADAVKEDRANEGVLVDTAEEGGAGEVEGSTGRDGVDIAGLIVGTANFISNLCRFWNHHLCMIAAFAIHIFKTMI